VDATGENYEPVTVASIIVNAAADNSSGPSLPVTIMVVVWIEFCKVYARRVYVQVSCFQKDRRTYPPSQE